LNTLHNRRYTTGLDGLRAFAILSVVFYHFTFSWAKGGFLGVNIFFVLSGYLVTSKILLSQDSFKIKTFWRNRFYRIFPSTFFMIIVTVLWILVFDHKLLPNILGDTISSVSYTANWWFIFHKISYFDSFGSPSPFKHMWFLAVQEQFYILWPIILIIGLKATKKSHKLPRSVFIGALISAALMGILYNPDADPSRIYYGTDTRCFELLIGSFLAIVLVDTKLLYREMSSKQKNKLKIMSIISFAIFLASVVFIDEYNSFLYRGGLFLFSLNTALLIACICHPKGILNSLLSWKPLRWIGTRSYEIYLWHYPIMVLSTPIHEIGNPSYLRVFFQLIVTCIIAECSYRFIELPFRKYGLCGYFNHLTLGRIATVILTFFVIISFSIGTINTERIKSINANAENANQITKDKTIEAKTTDNNLNDEKIQVEDEEKNIPIKNDNYKEILAIGDSILLDVAPSLNEKYENITIDGKIGRQMSEGTTLANQYAKFNDSDKAVIIELGSNGYFTNKQIDGLLDSFSESHVFLINVRVPRPWESKVNKSLNRKAEERENVTLIDWYSIASEHPEYFEQDGVHLNFKGVESLENLIIENMGLE
jgi:peptidoglycan/LPS O-acetylase OafA/YrhL